MKKLLISLSVLCLSSSLWARVFDDGVEINHCEFALSNDSGYGTIYVTTNNNLASVVNKKTLQQTANVQPAQSNATAVFNTTKKPAKIVSNWFYVYIPTTIDGQYMKHYRVEAKNCEKQPKSFKISYSQIKNNSADDRITIEDLSGNLGAEARKEPTAAARKASKQQKPKVRRTKQSRATQGTIGEARPSQPEYEVYVDRQYPMGMFPGNVAPVPKY